MSRTCPLCAKPVVAEHAPFCSPRCRDVDLHRWLGGHYAIPAVESDDAMPDEEDDHG